MNSIHINTLNSLEFFSLDLSLWGEHNSNITDLALQHISNTLK